MDGFKKDKRLIKTRDGSPWHNFDSGGVNLEQLLYSHLVFRARLPISLLKY